METRTEWDTSSEGEGEEEGERMRGLSEKEGDEKDEDREGVWERRREQRQQDLGLQKWNWKKGSYKVVQFKTVKNKMRKIKYRSKTVWNQRGRKESSRLGWWGGVELMWQTSLSCKEGRSLKSSTNDNLHWWFALPKRRKMHFQRLNYACWETNGFAAHFPNRSYLMIKHVMKAT